MDIFTPPSSLYAKKATFSIDKLSLNIFFYVEQKSIVHAFPSSH